MKKSKSTLCVFIDEVRDDVLVLLSLFDGEECFADTTLFFFSDSIPSLFRREIAVYTHESCGSSDILVLSSIIIVESFDEVDYSSCIGLGSHIKKYDEFRFQETAEAFEKPKMRRQFGSIEVLETRKDL
jgi:hypothetical protein